MKILYNQSQKNNLIKTIEENEKFFIDSITNLLLVNIQLYEGLLSKKNE